MGLEPTASRSTIKISPPRRGLFTASVEDVRHSKMNVSRGDCPRHLGDRKERRQGAGIQR